MLSLVMTDPCGPLSRHSLMAQAIESDRPSRVFYFGISMVGTFRDGDWLCLEPVTVADLQPGDLVVYKRPANWDIGSERIVHRVMALVSGGVLLRGDRNPCSDMDVVFEPDLLGRVTHYERAGRVHPAVNGLRGLLWARALHGWYGLWRAFGALVMFLGRIPYRWLKRGGIVRRMWQPPIQRIRLRTVDGPLIKYVYRGRTVARWWPQAGVMVYRRPFDLVIPHPLDEALHAVTGVKTDGTADVLVLTPQLPLFPGEGE